MTVSVLIHPCQAARLAAAWCLRCICVAVPSQISPLIDRCVAGIEQFRTSPEAISGYSSALAAVLGGVKLSPLGVPHMKGKIIFNTAEELLRSASQNSRLSLNRTHAGWLLIGMCMHTQNNFQVIFKSDSRGYNDIGYPSRQRLAPEDVIIVEELFS